MGAGMTPLRAEVTRWEPADRVGALRLESGEVVRFGATACQGFTPRLGMTVFINGLGPHPLGGRKASFVRDLCVTEEEGRRLEAERAAREERERLRPLEQAATRLPSMPVRDGYAPAIRRISNLLPPDCRRWLRALEGEAERVAGADMELALDGSRPPWPFYDPSLWAFAHDPGGNVFALHLYPPVMSARSRVPVVLWDHEQAMHFFQAESLGEFLAQHLYAHAEMGEAERADSEEIARALGVEVVQPRPERLRWEARPELDWPVPTAGDLDPVPLESRHLEERRLVRQLIEAVTPDDVVAVSSALDALYEELGWTHHLDVLRHQRAEWFEDQRRELTRR
ncbi:MAG: hypothetical protein SangKO_097540 [Sandaracinaceae bacterium]